MSQTKDYSLSDNNIRTLVYFFGIQLDHRITHLLKNTPYEKVRPSDSRVFVTATRGHETISEIARHLHISRQSAQSSVSRLVKIGLLNLANHPSSKREKLVIISDQGLSASAYAIAQLRKIETELAAIVGPDVYATLKRGLEALVEQGRKT